MTGPSGALQAIIDEPESVQPVSAQPVAIAVICHPHPQQGGTMNNKVVHTLARALNECAVPTVRFNYRGVGSSVGTYDGGVGETEDALAVIDWARLRWPDQPLWLAGFSFVAGGAG
jgi:alpha/beta superfamily hydrolase